LRVTSCEEGKSKVKTTRSGRRVAKNDKLAEKKPTETKLQRKSQKKRELRTGPKNSKKYRGDSELEISDNDNHAPNQSTSEESGSEITTRSGMYFKKCYVMHK
jgi:hypothetical protein